MHYDMLLMPEIILSVIYNRKLSFFFVLLVRKGFIKYFYGLHIYVI